MPRVAESEYEARLRRLEEQRRAGIELLEAAYPTEVAALEQLRAKESGAPGACPE